MSIKLKLITLNTYLEQTEGKEQTASLYVINRTKPRGKLCFSCINDLGTASSVVIPVTHIPVDLTTQTSREHLLKSAHFKRMLSIGKIQIVSNESAENLFENDLRSREERERLDGTPVDLHQTVEVNELEDENSSNQLNKSLLGASDFVRSLLNREESGDEDENALVNAFLAQADDMNRADLEALVDRSRVSEIKEGAAEYLEELKAR